MHVGGGVGRREIKDERERRIDNPDHREGLDRFSLPQNRCPVSTLDSNVALPVYRTFMAHKYQEFSMISLLYYQETLTVGRETRRPELLFGAIPYLLSHTYASAGMPEQLRDAGLPPIQPLSQRKQVVLRSRCTNYSTARAQIQSTVPRFILSWENERRRLYRGPTTGTLALAVPASG